MRILGAVLYENFELLDFCGPLEMFGNIGPELKIVSLATEQSDKVAWVENARWVEDENAGLL